MVSTFEQELLKEVYGEVQLLEFAEAG